MFLHFTNIQTSLSVIIVQTYISIAEGYNRILPYGRLLKPVYLKTVMITLNLHLSNAVKYFEEGFPQM